MCIRHAGISMGLREPGNLVSLAIAWVLIAWVFALGLPFVVDRAPPGPVIRPVTFLYLGDALLTSLVFVLLTSRAGVVAGSQSSRAFRPGSGLALNRPPTGHVAAVE